MMDFASDNVVGASAPIMAELAAAAAAGPEGTYGADRWTVESVARLEAIFERKLTVLLVSTGTAANSLCLAALTPPWGGVLCHAQAHVNDEECGAPEFFTGGAKLFGIPGADGKVTPQGLRETLARFQPGVIRQVAPASLSLSQATESGTLYTCDEIADLTTIAHEAGIGVHMDGARFANALVTLGCTPAAMTWKAGVDLLSFGATKNGALACEAVVVFDDARAPAAAVQRKRAGHTLSKGRVLGAQMAAYLRDDHWLDMARHANAAAARLSRGLSGIAGVRLPWPTQANEVFAVLRRPLHEALAAAGVHYYEWDAPGLGDNARPGADEVFVRLICSFETTDASVDALIHVARRAAGVASSPY